LHEYLLSIVELLISKRSIVSFTITNTYILSNQHVRNPSYALTLCSKLGLQKPPWWRRVGFAALLRHVCALRRKFGHPSWSRLYDLHAVLILIGLIYTRPEHLALSMLSREAQAV
jgi:hypothetical protein